MNKLKFRAWYKEGNAMYYDCLPLGGWDYWWIAFNNDKKYDGEFEVGKDIEVMQWTGLKDRNGIEIYEGDVACVSGVYRGRKYEILKTVYWNNECARFEFIRNDGMIEKYNSLSGNMCHTKVIGNIYEPHIATQDERKVR